MRPSRIALAGALALVSLFASAIAVSAQQQDGRPVHTWSFSEVREQLGPVVVAFDRQQGGRIVERHDFGPAAIDFVQPPDGIATGEIFSSATGNRYEVLAESPSHEGESPTLGGISKLEQEQSYQKGAEDATLRFTISEALVKTIDDNGLGLPPSECPAGRDCRAISAVVRFELRAYAESAAGDFFGTKGVAFIHGHAGSWAIEAATLPGAQVPLWDSERFTRDFDSVGDGNGAHAEAFLTEPLAVDVDLSSLATGELFATEITFVTQAVDTRGRESGVEAFIKNPEPAEPLVAFTGLRPRGEPTFDAPPATTPAPAVCPSGPAPGAGTLQFSRPDYVTDETVGTPFALVTRTGGSTGPVSASVITSDGSAVAGEDYRAVSTTVRFEDGDTSPRLVEIPIFQDAVAENAETFDVSLLDPNCVVFGAQTTAGVTVADVPEPRDVAPDGRVHDVSVVAAPVSGLDPTFGGDGRVSTALPGNTEAVVVQPDGMIVSAGGGSDFTLTRHDAEGDLDETFDADGIVTTELGSSDIAMDVALQTDGKIVAVGESGSDWAVARYLPDGTLDSAFSADGIVTTDFDGGFDTASGVAIDSDGGIVVAGDAGVSPPSCSSCFEDDFAVARYDQDGILDPTFGGGDGLLTTDMGTDSDLGNDVALDADGRIVVVGQVDDQQGSAIVRYETDGDVDTTFGGGPVITDLGQRAVFEGVAIRPADGKIVLAGFADGISERDFALAMVDENGVLDTSIGDAGLVTTDVSGGRLFGDDFGHDLVIQADGKIVVVGRNTGDTIGDLAIVRYTADAELDESFGGDGMLVTDFHAGHDVGNDVALQPDGKIVAAVDAVNGGDFALARALP